MNVALTRAKYAQIVFGNKDLLKIDEYWEDFINNYETDELLIKEGFARKLLICETKF